MNLGSEVFRNCNNLKTAGPIGEGYDYEFGWTEEIPAFAFSGCSHLTSVEIPKNVSEIGESAFAGCSRLKSIRLPAELNYIGKDAFADCGKLKDVYYPGPKSDWKKVEGRSGAFPSNPTMHYNSN